MAASPIIIENLSHHFGKGNLRKQILFDVNVEIPQGEIVEAPGLLVCHRQNLIITSASLIALVFALERLRHIPQGLGIPRGVPA